MIKKEIERKEKAKAALGEFKKLESQQIFRTQMDTYDIYKGIARLEETIERLEKRNAALVEELNRPTDEKLEIAHEEIKKLKEEMSLLRRKSLHVLSDKEREEAHNFWEEHRKVCPHKGRSMTWLLTGTGIGTAVEYQCSCGEKIDVTDIGTW